MNAVRDGKHRQRAGSRRDRIKTGAPIPTYLLLDGVGSSAALSELDNASVIGPTIPPSASNNFVTEQYPSFWIPILCEIGLDGNIQMKA